MSTEPNAEREAMIERAKEALPWFKQDVLAIGRVTDFALAETATLRQQLATSREALERIQRFVSPEVVKDSCAARRASLSFRIAREALAKMEHST